MPPITRSTASELLAALPAAFSTVLRVALRHAGNTRLALVGGTVRDLALGLELAYDLDLMIEGDAPGMARALAQALAGQLEAEHSAFGTATLSLPLGQGARLSVDVSAARREIYPHPAALPLVTATTLEHDLARRDFSLNAFALELLPSAGETLSGRLLDPFAGLRDLAAGQLRVLHNQSFVEDPTRILRGVRLAARLGLECEAQTRLLLTEALAQGTIERTSAERVRSELCLALAEPQPDKVMVLAEAWGVLTHLFAPLGWNKQQRQRWQQAASHWPMNLPRTLLALGVLTYDLEAEQREALIGRYRLPGEATRLLREVGTLRVLREKLAEPNMANSQISHLLQPFGEVALHTLRLAEDGLLATRLEHYLGVLRPLPTLLGGRDLLALGVAPGPQVGLLLARLRAAQLDGEVATAEQARVLIGSLLSSKF